MSRAAANQRFVYRAMGAGAGVAEGEIDSTDSVRARAELKKRGLVVLDLRVAERAGGGPAARGRVAPKAGAAAGSGLGAASLRDRAAWRRARAEALAELSMLLEAGMALDAALETVSAKPSRAEHRAVLERVARAVREGRTLAEAIRTEPDRFPTLLSAMAQVGEESGRLPMALRLVSQQAERAERLRQQVTGALMYPAILVVVGAVIMTLLVQFVIPQFVKIFEETGARPPLFSRMVIAAAQFAGAWWPALLAGAAALGLLLRARWRDENARSAMERWLIDRTPVGEVWWKKQSASFAGVMSMLLHGGTPMLRALDIARASWTSVEMRRRLDEVIASMRAGGRLSESVRQAGLLPDRADRLVAVGEESGRLAEVFDRLAEGLENEVGRRAKQALTLLEPAAILVVAVFVGAVVIAMLLAMFSINDVQTM